MPGRLPPLFTHLGYTFAPTHRHARQTPLTRPFAPPAPDSRALLVLVTGAVAIAFAPILVRVAETGPVATAFWRVTLALPPLWLLRARVSRKGAPPVSGLRWLLIGAGLFFAGDLGIWHTSIKLTSVANSTFLVNMAPLFVTLGGWLLFSERVTPLFVAGMATALAGAWLLSRGHLAPSAATVTGDVLALFAAMSYAGYLLVIKRLRSRGGDTAAIMAWSSTVTAAALLPAMLLSGEQLVPDSAAGWLTLLALAVVPHVAGQSLIAWAMAHLPASFSAVALLVQPVAASLLAWVLLAEPVSLLQAGGGAAVLAGVALARRGSRDAAQ